MFSQKDPSICEKKCHYIDVQSIENKSSARIYGNQRGWAFSKIDYIVSFYPFIEEGFGYWDFF